MECLICGNALFHDGNLLCEVCREKATKQLAALFRLPVTDPHPIPTTLDMIGCDFDRAVDSLGLRERRGRR